jgi:hypothetical protein
MFNNTTTGRGKISTEALHGIEQNRQAEARIKKQEARRVNARFPTHFKY